MQQNVVGGSIAFNKSWMDKYPRFFSEYNAWYAKANKLKFNTGTSDVADLAKLIDPDDFFDRAMPYVGPEYRVEDIMWWGICFLYMYLLSTRINVHARMKTTRGVRVSTPAAAGHARVHALSEYFRLFFLFFKNRSFTICVLVFAAPRVTLR